MSSSSGLGVVRRATERYCLFPFKTLWREHGRDSESQLFVRRHHLRRAKALPPTADAHTHSHHHPYTYAYPYTHVPTYCHPRTRSHTIFYSYHASEHIVSHAHCSRICHAISHIHRVPVPDAHRYDCKHRHLYPDLHPRSYRDLGVHSDALAHPISHVHPHANTSLGGAIHTYPGSHTRLHSCARTYILADIHPAGPFRSYTNADAYLNRLRELAISERPFPL
jgi:hypothetical protein